MQSMMMINDIASQNREGTEGYANRNKSKYRRQMLFEYYSPENMTSFWNTGLNIRPYASLNETEPGVRKSKRPYRHPKPVAYALSQPKFSNYISIGNSPTLGKNHELVLCRTVNNICLNNRIFLYSRRHLIATCHVIFHYDRQTNVKRTHSDVCDEFKD